MVLIRSSVGRDLWLVFEEKIIIRFVFQAVLCFFGSHSMSSLLLGTNVPNDTCHVSSLVIV